MDSADERREAGPVTPWNGAPRHHTVSLASVAHGTVDAKGPSPAFDG